ncbi:putative recombination protein Bet [Leptospira phage LE4]|uniref:Putative recombination protein Bet n=1 Tax=Leptospira phage LE4 TaxID=2041383 RepID=A0A343LEG3_9CAUD|nr:RecT-like ssDNA annealing protein [Leptospira phage LE4]ATN95073.1 putative recombination protein Bet [Leptospira phage LE4]
MTTTAEFRWDDQETKSKLRKAYQNLTDQEFENFCTIGQTLGANPYTREIFAIKYGENSPANIFCGRDLYQRKAQEQPDFDGMVSYAIYEADGDLEIIDGVPSRKSINPKHFGTKVVGAVATVYRKNVRFPSTVIVDFKEYYQGKFNPDGTIKKRYDKFKKSYEDMKDTVWDEKGATMIKKVAESQALRSAYLGIFKGTYDESEKWKLDEDQKIPEAQPTAPAPKDEKKPEPEAPKQPEPAQKNPEPKEPAKQEKKENDPKPSAEQKEKTPEEIKKEQKKEADRVKYKAQLGKRLQSAIDSNNHEAFNLVEKEWNDFQDTFKNLGIFEDGLEFIKAKRELLKPLEGEE